MRLEIKFSTDTVVSRKYYPDEQANATGVSPLFVSPHDF